MNLFKNTSKRALVPPIQSWVYFLVFTFTNILLSYGSLSLEAKLWTGLIGFLLPFILALRTPTKASPRESFSKMEIFSPPPWVWGFVGLLGIFLRFYHLTTFLDFPLYDEIINALYAIRLNEQWTWNPFFGGTLLSFYIWLLSFMFKVFGVSLFSLWALPAGLSLLSVIFFYAAVRRFFSPSIAFCMFFLLSASFWPVFIGKFSHQAVLMVFWESVAFLALTAFIKAPSLFSRGNWALFLGFWVGLGFYTYFAWPLVAALIIMTVLLSRGHSASYLKNQKIWFCAAVLIAVLPEAGAVLQQNYGDYLSSLWAFHRNPENTGGWNPLQNIHYFTSFFWEGWKKNFAYNPIWGGFLNPLLASLFFLGCVDLLKNTAQPLAQWFLAAFALLFFPILLANNTNWFHVAGLMPFFLLVASLGLHVLYLGRQGPWIRTSLLALALASMGFDKINLEKTREYVNLNHPSRELGQTYRILDQIERERGPGLIFSDLWLKPWPPFLGFATTPFNILQWKNGIMEKSSWAAIITNVNNQPFLKRRFPDGKAYWISKDRPPADGGVMLWIMPSTPDRLPVFDRWQRASQSLRPFLDQYAMVGPNENHHYDIMLEALSRAYPSFQGDPFLESTFWEVTADINLRKILWTTSDSGKIPLDGNAVPAIRENSLFPCLQALQYALKRGYPSANLYHQLGTLEFMGGNRKESSRVFQKATQAPLDFTDSSKYISIPKPTLSKKGISSL